MPGTASGLGVDPTDPVANLDGGGRYLAGQLDSFGRVDLAVAAYNAGPGAVRQAGGVPDYPETQAYVRRVLGYYQQLGGTL
jgi:soluble lytic murein transglycosylase-like protein